VKKKRKKKKEKRKKKKEKQLSGTKSREEYFERKAVLRIPITIARANTIHINR